MPKEYFYNEFSATKLLIFSYLGKYGDYQTVNPLIASIIIIIVQMIPLETLHFHP